MKILAGRLKLCSQIWCCFKFEIMGMKSFSWATGETHIELAKKPMLTCGTYFGQAGHIHWGWLRHLRDFVNCAVLWLCDGVAWTISLKPFQEAIESGFHGLVMISEACWERPKKLKTTRRLLQLQWYIYTKTNARINQKVERHQNGSDHSLI